MGLSLHMDRLEPEKLSPWWETTKIPNGKASFPVASTMSSLPFRLLKIVNMLFVLVSSKSTMKKFSICLI